MFDFGDAGNRRRVEAILTSRMNGLCFDELRGSARTRDRSACVIVTCVVPRADDGGWDFAQAMPALSRDISQTGVSVLHNAELSGEYLVEVPRVQGSDFMRCTVQHSSQMGRGFFHIGMSAKEVVHVEALDRNKLERRLAEFEVEAAAEPGHQVSQ
jgi:hypothetical protein